MNDLILESRSFQLLCEDQSYFGNGYTFGAQVMVYIGEHGKLHVLDSLADVLTLPGVSIFQWLPDWADGFDGTTPYSEIPRDLAEQLTKTERLIYTLLRENTEAGIHQDLVIRFAMGKMVPDPPRDNLEKNATDQLWNNMNKKATDQLRNNLRTYITRLRKKLPNTEKIICKHGLYKLEK